MKRDEVRDLMRVRNGLGETGTVWLGRGYQGSYNAVWVLPDGASDPLLAPVEDLEPLDRLGHGDRVLHTRLEETGTVIEDEALPKHTGEVWVLFDGRQPGTEVAVSGHLLQRLREQRVAVSAADWQILMEVLGQTATRSLHKQLVAGVVERAQRIE